MSFVLNLLTAILAVRAVSSHMRRSPWKVVLRYFTSLSNLFCAAASLSVAVMRLTGENWAAQLLWKYISTVTVTVTLLTVFLFLYRLYGFRVLLTGPDLWLHLICPVLALVSYYGWDRIDMSLSTAMLGIVPVAVYGAVYLKKVVIDKEWKDFYGFNNGGRWRVSLLAMLFATAALCAVMWLAGNAMPQLSFA